MCVLLSMSLGNRDPPSTLVPYRYQHSCLRHSCRKYRYATRVNGESLQYIIIVVYSYVGLLSNVITIIQYFIYFYNTRNEHSCHCEYFVTNANVETVNINSQIKGTTWG